MSKFDDAFGDAVYEAWRSGRDPDRVDRDRVRDDVDDGYDRFECAERELHRLRNQDRRAREHRMEEEYEEQHD